MIRFENRFSSTLKSLHNILKDLQYDWFYHTLKGDSYFMDPALAWFQPSVNKLLTSIELKYQLALRLFCFGERLDKSSLAQIIPINLMEEFLSLGLIMEENGKVFLDGYTIIPWLGTYIISNIDPERLGGKLSYEEYTLTYNMLGRFAESLIDLNCQCGFIPIAWAQGAKKITTVCRDTASRDITEANLALNDLQSKITILPFSENLSGYIKEYEWIVTTENTLPIPPNYSAFAARVNGGADGMTSLRRLLEVITEETKFVQIIAKCVGNEIEPAILKCIEEYRNLGRVKIFILLRKYINNSYFQILADSLLKSSDELLYESCNGFAQEIKSYYAKFNFKYYYSIILHFEPQKQHTIDIFDFTTKVRFGKQMRPSGSLIIDQQQGYYIITPEEKKIPIDGIQKSIVELLQERKLTIREIANYLATKYDISFESAAAKALDFFQTLYIESLISTPEISTVLGQVRLMQIRFSKLAELENENKS